MGDSRVYAACSEYCRKRKKKRREKYHSLLSGVSQKEKLNLNDIPQFPREKVRRAHFPRSRALVSWQSSKGLIFLVQELGCQARVSAILITFPTIPLENLLVNHDKRCGKHEKPTFIVQLQADPSTKEGIQLLRSY